MKNQRRSESQYESDELHFQPASPNASQAGKSSHRPPDLPSDCRLPGDETLHSSPPPRRGEARAIEATTVAHKPLAGHELLQRRVSGRRDTGKVRSTSWLSSIGLHLVAILILALVLAPADFGGTGTASFSLFFQTPTKQDALAEFDLPISALDDSSNTENQSESNGLLAISGIGGFGDASGLAAGRAEGARGSFFGIDAGGHEFVYVLDMSGSMEGRRYERATKELVKSVDQLGAHQSFYVLLFSSETVQMFGRTSFRPRPIAATEENKSQLEDWLKEAFKGGGTDPRDALKIAMRMNPSAIFMLSDGQFNGQKNQKKEKLLGGNTDAFSIVAASSSKPPIHAVAFEDHQSQANMKRLAEMTEGEYRFIEEWDQGKTNEVIEQSKLAIQSGELAKSEGLLSEAVDALEGITSKAGQETKQLIADLLAKHAELGMQNGQLSASKMALQATARLDPSAELTEAAQAKLADNVVRALGVGGDQADATETLSFLAEFVEQFPNSPMVGKVQEPIALARLSESKKLYLDGDPLLAFEALESVLAKYSSASVAEECKEVRDRVAGELFRLAQQEGKEKGRVAEVQSLRALTSAFADSDLKPVLRQKLEEHGMQMLVEARDAGMRRDRQAMNRLQQELTDGFEDDSLLVQLRRDFAAQERIAQEIFARAYRMERMSLARVAAMQYQRLTSEFANTLAAQKAKFRLSVLSRF